MSTIKFSHLYAKLVSSGADVAGEATLLEVLPVKLEDLSAPFLDYDTDCGRYPVPPKGAYLLLIFRAGRGIFPTLRRSTPAKEQYYRSKIGDLFTVIIQPNTSPAQ